jgi:hypothetical protein
LACLTAEVKAKVLGLKVEATVVVVVVMKVLVLKSTTVVMEVAAGLELLATTEMTVTTAELATVPPKTVAGECGCSEQAAEREGGNQSERESETDHGETPRREVKAGAKRATCSLNERPIKHAPCRTEKHSSLVRSGCDNAAETQSFSRRFLKNGKLEKLLSARSVTSQRQRSYLVSIMRIPS